MAKGYHEFTSENWQAEVMESKEPVLVDFWAEWCPPCRMIAPSIETLAGELAGRVKVGKLNVDESEDVAGRYGIRSIPTLLLFRDGKVAGEQIGAAALPQLRRFVEENATPR